MNPELPKDFLHVMLPLFTMSEQITTEKHAQILDKLKNEGFQSAMEMLTNLLTINSLKRTARLNYPDTGSINRLSEY